MGKLLFWVVLIIAVLFVARIAARMAAARQADEKKSARRNPPPAAPKPAAPESMVRCAHCGIHLPRSEAVLQNGLTWCSTEHAALGKK
ncbi:PP0621 family protein [Achromobacter pestifer]